MKYRGFLMALALGCVPAFAATTFESGGKSLRVSDPQTALVAALGEPARKVSVEDSKGGHVGDYFYYNVDGRTIRFLIRNDRIAEIFEIR